MTRTPSKSTRNSVSTPSSRHKRQSKNQIIEISSSDDEATHFKSPAITPTKHKSSRATDSTVTPPKQKKTDENSLSPKTPSTLLRKLILDSPEKYVEPKSLFKDQYQSARKALHSTAPAKLPGREKELSELHEFIRGCIANNTSSSLYISGPPGTGKTASLSVILQEPQVVDLKKVFVNCTAIKSARAVFARIVNELNLKVNGHTEKDNLEAIEKYLRKQHKMILLILDEIDQLDSKNQSVLYTIFEWPAKPNSKLILIGIANALDLTDRTLPRLQARCELKPKLMHFAPYSKQQLVHIFTERLKESNISNVFSPVAIQMLAGKVAAVSGDVRRALDIGRRVVELAEQQNTKGILQAVENLTEAKKPDVDLKHVVTVLNNVYGTAQNLNEEDAFPLQQKVIVCSLLLILKKAKNKNVTVGKLHEVYKKVCKKRNLTDVDQAEFVGLCSLIETRGIIKVVGKNEPRLHKVTLEWNEDEVVAVLKDKQLLSSILEDVTCLGKL